MTRKRRGRPARESLLGVRIRQRLENPPARLARLPEPPISIADLEKLLELPADTLRDICRGRTGRNRLHKLGVLARVASLLEFPLDELAGLAGIKTFDGKAIDFGTPEVALRRIAVAKGGDPRLCGSALGILLAHGEVPGQLGISERMHWAGERFGQLARAMFAEPQSSGGSVLGRLATEANGEAPPQPPTDARLSYIGEAYRSCWECLRRADAKVRDGAIVTLHTRPSSVVWSVVCRDELPRFATFDLPQPIPDGGRWTPSDWAAAEKRRIAEERASAIAGWLALRVGLRALANFFRSPLHAQLWLRYREDEDMERLGITSEEAAQLSLLEEGVDRLARKGIDAT